MTIRIRTATVVVFCAIWCVTVVAVVAAAQGLVTQRTLSLGMARTIADAALAE